MMTKLRITKEELEDLYIKREKSCRQIGEMFEVSSKTVWRHLKSNRIPARDNSAAQRLVSGNKIPDKKVLEEMYLTEKKSIKEICKRFNLNWSTVYRWFKYYKIKRRNRKEMSAYINYPYKLYEEEVIKLYKQGLSSLKITSKLNLGKSSVLGILKKKGIKKRTNKDYRKLDYDLIAENYQKEKSMLKVAKIMNISVTSVYKAIKAKGLISLNPAPKKGSPTGREPKNKLKLPGEDIKNLYIKMMPTNKIAEIYNTSHQVILKRLKGLGVDTSKRRTSIYSYNEAYVTLGMNYVKSFGELIIANWLFNHALVYEYNQRLPNSKMRYDFKIVINGGIYYIEYFGLIGKDFYDEKVDRKLNFYKDRNLNLLAIYPKDNITTVLETRFLN